MWDASPSGDNRGPRRGIVRYLPYVLLVLLSIALVASLIWHPAITPEGLVFLSYPTPTAEAMAVDPAVNVSDATAAQTTQPAQPATVQSTVTGETGTAVPTELDAMIGDLQAMQSGLMTLAQKLDQRNATPAATTQDLPAMLAEMQRLNQIMQPLMVQIETASRSARPASELAAMRAQMDEIHNQLGTLMAAIEAASAQNAIPAPVQPAAMPTPVPAPATVANSDQANYTRLHETLVEMQMVLQQVRTNPAFTTP